MRGLGSLDRDLTVERTGAFIIIISNPIKSDVTDKPYLLNQENTDTYSRIHSTFIQHIQVYQKYNSI